MKAVQGPWGGREEEGDFQRLYNCRSLHCGTWIAPIRGFKQSSNRKEVRRWKRTKTLSEQSLTHWYWSTESHWETKSRNQKKNHLRAGRICGMPLSLQRARLPYLVGISMSENCVVLSRAVAGSVFVHSWSGRGFFQQTALCTRGEKEFKTLLWRESSNRKCEWFTLSVSSGDPRVAELWFRRRRRLSITWLALHHLQTGLGLEKR